MNIQSLSTSTTPPGKMSVPGFLGEGVHFILAERLALVRQSIGHLLREAWPGATLTPVATLAEVSDVLTGTSADILLLDHALAGSAIFIQVRSALPELRVIVLTDGEERACVIDCLLAGANGVVSKAGTFAEMQHAIDMVRAGHVHVPDFMSQAPARAVRPAPAALPTGLTDRQRDVLRLLATGQSTKDIARSLNLAVSTIKVHLAAVYRTLGARNRIDALFRAGALPSEAARIAPGHIAPGHIAPGHIAPGHIALGHQTDRACAPA